MRACNSAVLPGNRSPFRIGSHHVGYLSAAISPFLADHPALCCASDGIRLTDAAALPAIAQSLSKNDLFRFRGELFDVRADPDGPVLAQIDRGALPFFGIQAVGVHVNGLVNAPDGLHVWIARRARDKALDPGKLDHIVAGGVPAGLSPHQTLIKEAAEEASIPQTLAVEAIEVGLLQYAMDRPEGLRRDRLVCYDLLLPPNFVPVAADGEVEAFELWPIDRVFEAVRTTDDFKFNVNLVLIDLFIRRGMISGPEAAALTTALHPASCSSIDGA